MKKNIIASIIFITLINGCTKPQWEEEIINMGNVSTTTTIKSVTQTNNIVKATFETTIGSKYAVQIIPFGGDIPVKKYSFTADENLTVKEYDLNGLDRKDYDLIFIDISGKEVKYPIVIK